MFRFGRGRSRGFEGFFSLIRNWGGIRFRMCVCKSNIVRFCYRCCSFCVFGRFSAEGRGRRYEVRLRRFVARFDWRVWSGGGVVGTSSYVTSSYVISSRFSGRLFSSF